MAVACRRDSRSLDDIDEPFVGFRLKMLRHGDPWTIFRLMVLACRSCLPRRTEATQTGPRVVGRRTEMLVDKMVRHSTLCYRYRLIPFQLKLAGPLERPSSCDPLRGAAVNATSYTDAGQFFVLNLCWCPSVTFFIRSCAPLRRGERARNSL